MMRSLFSGVSGLKNHQTRMDVIGNNISNVNTTGFKSSRVTFSDMISQTLTGASRPIKQKLGGTNPKQIGLGSAVSSIDLLFTNGSVQSTGKNTDLCLSGDGLFAVSPDGEGKQKYYTRNGAFSFDADGNYVQPGSGMHVLGYMAKNGKLEDALNPIKLRDDQKKMDGVETKNATYVENLDADTKGYEIGGISVKYADGTTETVTNYQPQKATGLSLRLESGEEVELDETAEYPFDTNASVTNKVLYTKKIDSVTATADSQVALELSTGNSVHSINGGSTYTPPTASILKGTYKYGDTYRLTGTIQTGGVTTSGAAPGHTKLTVQLTDGNTVTFEVPIPTGTPYADGDTVNFDFKISKITAPATAKVNLANGKSIELTSTLNVTDENQRYARKGTAADGKVIAQTPLDTGGYALNNKRVESVTLQGKDGSTHSGLLGADYAVNSTFYPSLVSTITVYDKQGKKYDVPVLLTKTKANTWKMSLQSGGNRITVKDKNDSTTTVHFELEDQKDLVFDYTGKYVQGSAKLSMHYENNKGVKPYPYEQSVTLSCSGLTQYAGSNTVSAKSDGYATGALESISCDTSGVLTGTYSNGVRQALAQVAVAKFVNTSGLTKRGESLYEESNNSGTADIKKASDAAGCKITPSALEMSNVDVANEFTDMIITQRGFQANSKTITVSDEMLETLIQMKR
ncbi:MAG: flagellar hook-basal body complex protein [Schwartzia sp. (in: firmicutes)]